MGNRMSEEEKREEEKKRIDQFVRQISEGPDLRVNKTIRMFTSVNSSDNLTQHYKKRKMQRGGHAADWMKRLAEKLANLSPDPKLAGLGALAIAVFIDIISASSSSSETLKEALRGVFAEEKASDVWDHIDECLKRCMMHIKNKDKLVGDIERIEVQLSAAITRLKNSMLRDGHMTSEALKAWVNGAAFHIQMLIHLVRLGGLQSCDPVERLISTYLRDLDRLFEKHKEVIEGKCDCRITSIYDPHEPTWYQLFLNEDSECTDMPLMADWSKYFEVYYDHRYDRQRCHIQQDFTQVQENLQELVHQRGSFNMN